MFGQRVEAAWEEGKYVVRATCGVQDGFVVFI